MLQLFGWFLFFLPPPHQWVLPCFYFSHWLWSTNPSVLNLLWPSIHKPLAFVLPMAITWMANSLKRNVATFWLVPFFFYPLPINEFYLAFISPTGFDPQIPNACPATGTYTKSQAHWKERLWLFWWLLFVTPHQQALSWFLSTLTVWAEVTLTRWMP